MNDVLGSVWIYVGVALVLGAVFVVVWMRDKRRADREATDPARTQVDPHRPHRH